MPGNSHGRKCAITSSSGTIRPALAPTCTNRGSTSGTLTRANRSSPPSGSRTSTPRLSESPEMYGNGWPGPTPSGVSTGNTSRSNVADSSASSSSSSSATGTMQIPRGVQRLAQVAVQSCDWRSDSSITRSRMSDSTACGVRPSAERTPMPAAACRSSPATRTMKNSSRFDEKIEQKRTRSSSGSAGSAASSSTRALKSSHESSRLISRSGAASSIRSISARLEAIRHPIVQRRRAAGQ